VIALALSLDPRTWGLGPSVPTRNGRSWSGPADGTLWYRLGPLVLIFEGAPS